MVNKFSRISKIVTSLIITIFVVLSCTVVAFGADTSYKLDDIGVSVNVPDNFQVITRDTPENDEAYSNLGFDYKETKENFKQGDIYLQAIDTENFLTLTITMTITEKSKEIVNYNELSEKELNQVRKGYMTDNAYKSCNKKKINGYTYLCLMTQETSDGQVVNSQQYNTVAYGNNYVVILKAANGKKLTKQDKDMLNNIISTLTINEPALNSKADNSTLVWTIIWIVAGCLVIVLIILLVRFIKNPHRKNKNLLHQLAHEHKITETTQIPRKKLHKYMLETAPEETDFMEEYRPLGEPEKPQVEEVKIEEPQVEEPKVEKEPEPKFAQVAVPEKVSSDTKRIVDLKAEVIKEPEKFEGGTEYFTDVPDEGEMFVYTDIETAVEDYRIAKKADQRRKRREAEQRKQQENKKSPGKVVLSILTAIGKGILGFLQGVVMVICYLAVHIKYFSINLYRLIKRKRAEKKRRKVVEERRRLEEERLQMRREAEMRRRQRNAQRGENDLIQVRSRNEGRTYPRSGGYDGTRTYNRKK